MKKKKLKLNKETLRYLKESQLGGVAGASNANSGCQSCNPSSCYTQCCQSLTCGCGPQTVTTIPTGNATTCPGWTHNVSICTPASGFMTCPVG